MSLIQSRLTIGFSQKPGAPSGVYTIRAASNNVYIAINPDGSLQNNGTEDAFQSAGFTFEHATTV
jgi:hypothetical protein